jgi:hypothetical protein
MAQPHVLDVGTAEAVAMVPAESWDAVHMFERLAKDPNASVEKIERLMALWERMEARRAESEFNAAMSAAQKGMRPVSADASNPQTKSRYASYGALDRAIRPVYTGHGFGLSFDTADGAPPDHVRVVCHVTHGAGYSRLYHIDMPADGKGAKGGDVMTKTHAAGSAVTYGMRYLLKMIFNVAVGEDDDDGNRAGKKAEVKPPVDVDAWFTDMTAVADNGLQALQAAWQASKTEFKAYANEHKRKEWEALKVRAAKVKAS